MIVVALLDKSTFPQRDVLTLGTMYSTVIRIFGRLDRDNDAVLSSLP